MRRLAQGAVLHTAWSETGGCSAVTLGAVGKPCQHVFHENGKQPSGQQEKVRGPGMFYSPDGSILVLISGQLSNIFGCGGIAGHSVRPGIRAGSVETTFVGEGCSGCSPLLCSCLVVLANIMFSDARGSLDRERRIGVRQVQPDKGRLSQGPGKEACRRC